MSRVTARRSIFAGAFTPLGRSGRELASFGRIRMSTSESQGPSVLIVDDEPTICRVVSSTLKRKGFRAASVSDASLLEETLGASSFDLVLLDRSMDTEENGALLPLLREKAPGAKILFFTGDYMSPEECTQVDGVVQKPVNGKELAEKLHSFI